MKHAIAFTLLALFLAGCQTSSKTDRALLGGAAGALTGAVIGGSSGSVEKALTGAAIGGAAGGTIGAVTAPKNCTLIDNNGNHVPVACP